MLEVANFWIACHYKEAADRDSEMFNVIVCWEQAQQCLLLLPLRLAASQCQKEDYQLILGKAKSGPCYLSQGLLA